MRVLIVEDEVGVRTFLCRAVTALIPDAQVLSAIDGQQGLRAFLAEPVDLVISDNRMPYMSGIDLLHALRERSVVPFIMVSAEPAFERCALLAGATACLPKPLTLGDLRTAIGRAMATSIGYTGPCTN